MRAQLIAIGDEANRRIGTVIILRDVTHDALAERLKDGFVAHIARDMERPVGIIKLAGELLSAQPEDAAVNQRCCWINCCEMLMSLISWRWNWWIFRS